MIWKESQGGRTKLLSWVLGTALAYPWAGREQWVLVRMLGRGGDRNSVHSLSWRDSELLQCHTETLRGEVTEGDSTDSKGEQDSCCKSGREERRGNLHAGMVGKAEWSTRGREDTQVPSEHAVCVVPSEAMAMIVPSHSSLPADPVLQAWNCHWGRCSSFAEQHSAFVLTVDLCLFFLLSFWSSLHTPLQICPVQ